MSTEMKDIIDLLAEIEPGSDLYGIRAKRPQARENAQGSYLALFEPDDVSNVTIAERYAVAAFVAGLHAEPATTGFYSEKVAIAMGGSDQVAVLFLSSDPASQLDETGEPLHCPVAPAVNAGTVLAGTGKGDAFHLTSDAPVSAYDILPYGGASSFLPSAELLLPTSAWGTNYVAAVPLQVFSAEVALARGYDVDKPRNLAKSVTVE